MERRPDNPQGKEGGESEKAPKALIELGQIVVTVPAAEAVYNAGHHSVQLFARHVSGDWGNLPEEDIKENELSIEKGYRVFSRYDLEGGQIVYVITEWDRSVTTLLLREEY